MHSFFFFIIEGSFIQKEVPSSVLSRMNFRDLARSFTNEIFLIIQLFCKL